MASEGILITVFAELYDTQVSSRRVAEAAKLKLGHIGFKDDAIENWYVIFAEAKKRRRVKALVDVACEDYSERREELENLFQDWQLSAGQPVAESVPYVTVVQRKEPEEITPLAKPELSGTIMQAPRPSLPKAPTTEDSLVFIGRELHWDRISVARMFLNMINLPEDPLHVLGIQAPMKEDLESLVNRFEAMCKGVTQIKPLLYAKILLREALGADWRLATAILNGLRENARSAKDSIVSSQTDTLTQARNTIERRSSTSSSHSLTGSDLLTGSVLCDILTDCLAEVARHCSVVLLLAGFDQLYSRGDCLQSGKWLRDMWLPERVRNVKGLVILLTGERGLDELARVNDKEIFCFHPDYAPLPSMNVEDFAEWAHVGFGFSDFTLKTAQLIYDSCHGSPKEFANFLRLRAVELKVNEDKD